MNPVAKDILMHYGMPRRSGRYPFGSGKDPYQHGRDFLGRIEELKKNGWTETPENIKAEFGITTSQYRIEKSLAKDERRMLNVAKAKSLKEDGLGDTEIGRQLGVNESTVRSWLNSESEARMKKTRETADFLKARLEEVAADGGMIDVGANAELELNVSKEKLNQALYLLQREGYEVYNGRFEQVTNRGNFTTQKVLCLPGTPHKDIYQLDKVHSIKEYISRDGGETFEKKFNYPESMDSKRMMVRYAEDGGEQKDGIVELRRGVEDLSLGNSRYSQVRILVDGTHYIKGMAVYADDKDFPPGVDVIFNTNKKQGTPVNKVLKEITKDPDNPFGSAIKDAEQGGQYWYTDKKTGEKKLGLINKRADEGDWSDWKDALPSQFLGKQSKFMAQKQLDLAKADKYAEFDDICSINNPTIKKHLLDKFADSCDSAAVHLQAAALPGQKYHVIIPINSLKDTEVYAPNYENGTKLALIRYPHAGTFEIPILTVNNKHAEAKKLLGSDVGDAVGITKKVADRLSGADFDGDTVMCIPTHDIHGNVKIAARKENLKGLVGFDPKDRYSPDKVVVDSDGNEHYYQNGIEYRRLSKSYQQKQMGIISNLITDMTLAGANDTEMAAAVRHSMVIIDAHKHKLNYKQSEIDNNVKALHTRYQGKATGGAATILSRSKGPLDVTKRQGNPKINQKGKEWYDPDKPEGALIFKDSQDAYYPTRVAYDKESGLITMRTVDGKRVSYNVKDPADRERYEPIKVKNADGSVRFTNKAGDIEYRVATRTQKSTKMAETDDAYTLVSDARHQIELVYADYANSMKDLANRARMEQVNTGKIAYSKSAKAIYQEEVTSLDNKLKDALRNSTRERAAQRKANAEIQTKVNAGQLTDSGEIKKASQRALTKYRDEVGSVSRSKRSINITDREWEAIQAGAISENKLKRILDNTDVDVLRERATPKTTSTLSPAQINRAKALAASNYTLAEIAEKMGKSPSTISNYLKGVN